MTAYLDYNATAPLRPEAEQAWLAAAREVGNASSVHAPGRAARARVEEARRQIAHSCGFKAGELVFTSGGTESNHLALLGLPQRPLLVSAGAHASALQARDQARLIPLLPSGRVDLAALEPMLAALSAPGLVSVEWVNNETGVIQPVTALLEMCRRAGALLHVDATQAYGRLALDQPADLLTLSSHKLGGPPGVGALLVRGSIDLQPQLRGGGQERGVRSGTENVPAIAGFAAAAAVSLDQLSGFQARASWRDAFEDAVLDVPGVRIIGQAAPRVANTSCLVCPGWSSELQLIQLDLKGIAVSAGAACSSGKVSRSHVLMAMQRPEAELDSALRVSFGWKTAESELIFCAENWTQLARSAISRSLGN